MPQAVHRLATLYCSGHGYSLSDFRVLRVVSTGSLLVSAYRGKMNWALMGAQVPKERAMEIMFFSWASAPLVKQAPTPTGDKGMHSSPEEWHCPPCGGTEDEQGAPSQGADLH